MSFGWVLRFRARRAEFGRFSWSVGGWGGGGRSRALGELQHVVGETDGAPFLSDLVPAAQQELAEAAGSFDLSEHGLG